jgi:hypothetical protein
MKDLEIAGIIAAGAVVGLVLQNNKSLLQSIVPKITTAITQRPDSDFHPISTESPWAPVPPSQNRRACPPGMYEDWTDGILHCHDPGGTRELNPNVKMLNPEWQQAYRFIDNDEFGYSGKPQGWATSQRQKDIKAIEVTTDPDIPRSIAKTVLPPEKTQKKKRHLEPSKAQVSAQVECPKNLHDLPAGANCWKNGRLWKIVSSEKESASLYPKKPSITVPSNFPGSVTVTPGGGDEGPYPETDIGGEGPAQDVGPTSPDWNPHSSDDTSSTPPTTPATPPAVGQIGHVFYPFRPEGQKTQKAFAFKDHPSDANGCRVVDYNSGGSGRTCRWIAKDSDMRSHIGSNGYKIEANLHIGDQTNSRDQEISITSGGLGSSDGNCCGFTTRVNIDSGELQLEAEGAAQTDKIFCKGASCVDSGQTSIGKNLYGKDVSLTWIVTRQGNNNVAYQAIASGPGGTVVSKKFINPTNSGGNRIIPFQYISVGPKGKASDPHRVRVDSCKTVNFHNPKVTVIPANAYFGDLGYIDREDLLIY